MPKLSPTPQSGPKKSKFGIREVILLLVGGAIGASSAAAILLSRADADQPKRPGLEDVTGDQAEAGGGPPDDDEPHAKSECPDLTEKEILKMAQAISKSRDEWLQAMEELGMGSEPEPKVLTPKELKDSLIDVFRGKLGEKKYDKMVDMLDTDTIMSEAKDTDSEAIEEVFSDLVKPFNTFKKNLGIAETQDERIGYLADFLCVLMFDDFTAFEEIEDYYTDRYFDLMPGEDASDEALDEWYDMNRDEEHDKLAQDKRAIKSNPILRRFANGQFARIAMDAIGLNYYGSLTEINCEWELGIEIDSMHYIEDVGEE